MGTAHSAAANGAALPGAAAPGDRGRPAARPGSPTGLARLGSRRTARAGAGRPQVFPDAGARRAAAGGIAAIRRCEALFDATPGVLAVRSPDPGPTVDRLTRAARERAVDNTIAALNEAEAARRMLGVGQPRPALGQRSPQAEREAKASMLARLHLTRAEAGALTQAASGPALVTLRVRPGALSEAGRAALAVMLREAGVEVAVESGVAVGVGVVAGAGAGAGSMRR